MLSAATATVPFATRAQNLTNRPTVAFLSSVAKERNLPMINAFLQGMQELGFIEDRDFKFTYHSVEGHFDRLPSLAEEVLNSKPDVILATVTPEVVSVELWRRQFRLYVHSLRIPFSSD